jgi:hypothetical protein
VTDQERPQHGPYLEDEGIPDHEGPLPSNVRSGDQRDGIVPPGDRRASRRRFGTTAAEQTRGDVLEQRLGEEEADEPPAAVADDEPGQPATTGDVEEEAG